MTLTINLPEQTFQMALLLLKEKKVCNSFLKSMQLWPGQGQFMSIYDHFLNGPSSVTLIFNLLEQMFHMTLLLLKENNCDNYFEIHT